MNISNTEVLIQLFDYFEHKMLFYSYISVSESDDGFIKKLKSRVCFGK